MDREKQMQFEQEFDALRRKFRVKTSLVILTFDAGAGTLVCVEMSGSECELASSLESAIKDDKEVQDILVHMAKHQQETGPLVAHRQKAHQA